LNDRRGWVGLALVLAVALLFRFVFLAQFAALPFFEQPVGDSAAHLHRAQEIARGALLPSRPFFYCSIFYPYFLALVLGPSPAGLFAVSAIQVVAGTAVVGLLALASWRLFGWGAGLCTGALAALYGPSAFFEVDVLGVVWGQLGLAVALLLVVGWSLRVEPGGAAPRGALLVTGLALGFAVVERPNLLVVAAIVFAWCAALAGRRRIAGTLGPLLAGGALPLLVVLGLNVAGTGQWIPLTTSGGINLALGYHDGANGTYDEPWEREAPEFSARHLEPEEAMTAWASRKLGRPLTTQEASAYWGREALAWIAAHPRQAALLTVRKFGLMLNGFEVPNHLDYAFIRERVPTLWLMPVGFSALLALAALGAVHAWTGRMRPRHVVLFALVARGVVLSVVPFTVADRYRVPMVPALLVLAGPGVVLLAGLVRHPALGRDSAVRAALLAGGVALLVTLVPLAASLRGRDWWMFAQAYEAQGRVPEAIAAYEAAVREAPDDGQLLNNLANAYRRVGDTGRAIAFLRRAVEKAPGLAYPHKNLGRLLAGTGRLDAAREELEKARAIDSTDVATLASLGAVHAEQGRIAEARRAFAEARALAPHDAQLLAMIERYAPRLEPVTRR
jgi:hypothetical protein